MRFVLRTFLWLMIALLLTLTGLIFFALEDQPRVQRSAEFTPENIERARRILDENDPRKMKPGLLRTIAVRQEDADLAANYLANRYVRGSARLVLQRGTAFIKASTQIPGIGQYVNVEAALTETPALPHFEHVHIGRMPVPWWLADWVLARALARELPRSKLRGIKPPNPETLVVRTALARQFGGVDHGVSCVGTPCAP